MPNPLPNINYKKCSPERCNSGICAAMLECPHKVLRQEAPREFPFLNPSRFCQGCARCVEACPLKAIDIL